MGALFRVGSSASPSSLSGWQHGGLQPLYSVNLSRLVAADALMHRDRRTTPSRGRARVKFTTRKMIQFFHCDPAGIVFYPQYFYILSEAKEDFLMHIGHPMVRMITSSGAAGRWCAWRPTSNGAAATATASRSISR